ncbi:MAG: GAF domain-containing protein [Myxococcales bacterium]|nr:MAG: GAF domain-containing protein [Myxococcales bacterium]
MELRTQTSLLAGVLAIAIAVTVLLRPRQRHLQRQFSIFSLTVAAWYLATFATGTLKGHVLWFRIDRIFAVLLPIAAFQFFRAFVIEEAKRAMVMRRLAWVSGAVLIAAAFSPFYDHIVVSVLIFIYVTILLMSGLRMLFDHSRLVRSRFEQARLRFLAIMGTLAATFTVIDYLPYVGLDIPPVGPVLVLVFLYILSQSILHFRLLDMYELAGRLIILSALAFAIAGIYAVIVLFAGERFFLYAVVAALALLLVFDPTRAKLEEKFMQLLFRERFDLERALHSLRAQLVHVLELEQVVRVLLSGLEESRRFTHAAVFLASEDMLSFALRDYFGPSPVHHIEVAAARPLLDRLRREENVVLEDLEHEIEELKDIGDQRGSETVHEIVHTLEALNASVCIALQTKQELFGFLCIKDERVWDAFSPEEVGLLKGLASQLVIAVENSRLYEQLKERDRLAALGEMAAGLAHEIRNPLGAIKASAQYLSEPEQKLGPSEPESKEFLGIIVDETDRLNRVLSSFLDFARPSHGDPEPTDVNLAVQKTLKILNAEQSYGSIEQLLDLEEKLPLVRIDVEQLRQVLINLIRNAFQAMENRGTLNINTRAVERRHTDGSPRRWVEIRVSDTGPGIPQKMLSTLFVPFVTSRDQGTGLGLAISHRIITEAGGHVEVRTHDKSGTSFLIRLPISHTGVSQH